MFNTPVSDIQDADVEVGNDAITGTLKFLDSGEIASAWGNGNFIALKFTVPAAATSMLVGLDPSEGSGLVEIVGDPDANGVFKITDKDTQKFKIVATCGLYTFTKEYSLSGLTLETE